MKVYLALIFFLFCVSMNVSAWSFTSFSYSNTGNNFEFYLRTGFSFGAGSTCPRVYAYDVKKSNDTLFIIPYYDERGAWPFMGCASYDTIRYTNIFAGINYINVSKNSVKDGPSSTTDTVLNEQDTTFRLRPAGIAEKQSGSYTLSLYPNPATNILTLQNVTLLHCEEFICYNALGQIVHSGSDLIQNNGAINIADLVPGTYYLVVFDQHKLKTGSGIFLKN